MSAAAGAPPPPPGGGGRGNRKRPADMLDIPNPNANRPEGYPNTWEVDAKTKTCKCDICLQRVRQWSVKCVQHIDKNSKEWVRGCYKRICSSCFSDGDKGKSGYWQERKGCWNVRAPGPKIVKDEFDEMMRLREAHDASGVHGDKPQARVQSTSLIAATIAAGTPRARTASKKPLRTGNGNLSAKAEKSGQLYDDPETPDIGDGADLAPSNPDGDYAGDRETMPMITSSIGLRPRDEKKRPVIDSESEISDVAQSEASESTEDLRAQLVATLETSSDVSTESDVSGHGKVATAPIPHLHGGRTVVVGAGVIGLFIARELAIRMRDSGTQHQVTVVDARDNACQLASGHCSGFLMIDNMPEHWHKLAVIAHDSWRELLSTQEVQESLGYSEDTLLHAIRNIGQLEPGARVPLWFRNNGQAFLASRPSDIGRIHPAKLFAWLQQQCNDLDIDFRMSCTPDQVNSSAAQDVIGVTVSDLGNPRRSELIRCENLILAAGPFTPETFQPLFPKSILQLESNIQACEWLRVRPDKFGDRDDVGIILPSAARTVETLENDVAFVARPAVGYIQLSCRRTEVKNRRLGAEKLATPSKGRSGELRQVAAPYLNIPDFDTNDKSRIVEKGRSYIGVAHEERTIIDKVPASALGRTAGSALDDRPCGVWLSYGFGYHGTTLAPGAAIVLVDKMIGKSGESEEFNTSLPEYQFAEAKTSRPAPDTWVV